MDISPAEHSISPANSTVNNAGGDSKQGGITSTSSLLHDHHRNGLRERDRDRMSDRDRDRDRDRERDRDRRDRDRDSERSSDRSSSRREERGRAREREPRVEHERSRSHLRDDNRSQSPWDKDGTPERRKNEEFLSF